ncbi:MAG: lipid asymmetry maintenance protein MlaB [Woeseiaceae bacterium]
MTSHCLSLPESLKIDIVGEFKASMDTVLKKGGNVDIDGAALAVIDYSGVQLLLTFIAEVRSHGNTVSWQSPSDTLKAAAEDMGALQFLALEDHAD